MANMSYCRFQNTANDLEDCADEINDSLQGSEFNARERLIETCKNILESVGYEVTGEHEFEEFEYELEED